MSASENHSTLPSVSIVVVTYNGRELLENLLPSLEALDYPRDRLEILCVDNGSRDGTVEMLAQRYPAVRVLRNVRNEGFATPNNQAAREARGEILALINNDMRAEPSWLREGLVPLLDDPQTAAVGCRILNWDGTEVDFAVGTVSYCGFGVHPDLGRRPQDVEEATEPYPETLFGCGGALLVRKSVFLELGGFDDDFFAVLEDVDLGWRMGLAGWKVRLAPRAIVYHRRHGTLRRGGREKHRFLMLRNALMMAVKNYSSARVSGLLAAVLHLALRRVIESARLQRENFYFWSDESFPETYQLDRRGFLDSMTEAVALEEVLSRMPQLAAKRQQIQSIRKVEDEAILKKFGDPFRLVWKEPGTLALEEELAPMLGLESLFGTAWPGGGERRERLERHESELAMRIRHREGELDLMSLRLDLAKRALEDYLGELQAGRPLVPREATRRGLPILGRLARGWWLLKFYWRFEGPKSAFSRLLGVLARKLGFRRQDPSV